MVDGTINADDSQQLTIFVTVGTTRFDTLIRTVLSTKFLTSVAALSQDAQRSASTAKSSAKITIQYGNSSIADVLTSSSLASIDDGSELVPEPGLRIIDGRRVYQNKAQLPSLDPGKTGTLTGLRLRPAAHASRDDSGNKGKDAKATGANVFGRMLEEAKAMQGVSSSAAGASGLADQILELTTSEGVSVEMFQFAPDLGKYIKASDLVISHAGSGTILDTLRMRPEAPALIAVPNTSLMDNHQAELADALAQPGYLVAGTEATLAEDVRKALENKATGGIVAFPDFDPSRFTSIVDDLMLS
ncbi:hypothetical protein BCV70DRAFT_159335 [Testicularia cyperi]|uniref:UDP-N-acetylglucosamine transferase subunit ALG13 n=1 Tax=Testicularia cyperi TaxID=1882483 RepID=A0A317XRV4_9BASI|nr:hypothetical protein BCV70DRAFT_159335 [Testicularia cyperi]